MTPAELSVLRDKVVRARLQKAAEQAKAAMYTGVRCPVHKRLVSVEHGRLVGRCDLCVEECARAIKDIVEGVASARQWAQGILGKDGT